MKLAFEKLLETNDLEISDLPKITQVEIKELTQLKSLIVSKMNIGQNVTPATLQKIKDKDNEIVDDILEYLGEEDDDTDDYDDDNIDRYSDDDDTDEDDNNNDDTDEDDIDEDNMDAITIDRELHNLYKSGATILTLADLRDNAPTTYECIFDTYGQDEENGINTSNYTIVETSLNSEKFKILKK